MPGGFNSRRSSSPAWRWQLLKRYELTRAPDRNDDGCFATAFSPSGHLCAVASQDGIITVFNTNFLGNSNQDSIIEVIPSSRPHSRAGEGAIRSLCFSPDPWDLLICTEQSGRVCVIDLRSGFRIRQLVNLVQESDIVKRVDILDDPMTDDLIDPRLRNSTELEFVRQYRETMAVRDEAAAADFAVDYIEASAERQWLHRHARNESPQSSTERERQILDAPRTSRERIEAREQAPVSITFHLARDSRDPPSLLSQGDSTNATPLGSNGAHPISTPSRRDRQRERHSERDSTRTRPYEAPRRRSAVHAENEFGADDTVPDLVDPAQPPSTLNLRTYNLDPWQAIESTLASIPRADGEARPRQEREGNRRSLWMNRRNLMMLMELETRNSRRLMESRRRERLRNLYAEVEGTGRHDVDSPRRTESESHLGTTGCVMSRDGRKL